jgi:hypothetical protein
MWTWGGSEAHTCFKNLRVVEGEITGKLTWARNDWTSEYFPEDVNYRSPLSEKSTQQSEEHFFTQGGRALLILLLHQLTQPTSFYSWSHVSLTCPCTFDCDKSREKKGVDLFFLRIICITSYPVIHPEALVSNKCKDNANHLAQSLALEQHPSTTWGHARAVLIWVYNATAPLRRRTSADTSPTICSSSQERAQHSPCLHGSTFWACLHWLKLTAAKTDTPESTRSSIRCLPQHQIPF